MLPINHCYLGTNLRFVRKIGSGAYGLVYLVQNTTSGKKYALKVISKLTNNKNYNENNTSSNNHCKPSIELEKNLTEIFTAYQGRLPTLNELNLDTIEKIGHNYHYLKEISIHLKVNQHPNVVTLHKVYNYQEYLFILMDYYENGDLFTTIVDKKYFCENPMLIKKIFLQLISAIKYCHDRKIYHCDIKPENILINDDYSSVAIIDFGLAVQTEYVSDLCCGSSYYMAPERLLNQSQRHGLKHNSNYFPTSAGDIWSLGIILINLTCIRNPWMKASLNDETFEIYLNKNEVLYKILPISKELLFILTNYFLVQNPYKRSTSNLEIIKKLIVNCKRFTKSGPLSKCDVYVEKQESAQNTFSPITTTTTTIATVKPINITSSVPNKRSCEVDEDDLSSSSTSNKRLSINSNSCSSLSSLSSISSTGELESLISNSSSITSNSSSSLPITIQHSKVLPQQLQFQVQAKPTPSINTITSTPSEATIATPAGFFSETKSAANTATTPKQIKFIKSSNEVNYLTMKQQQPLQKRNPHDLMSINNLIDFEFTFDSRFGNKNQNVTAGGNGNGSYCTGSLFDFKL